MLHQSGVPSHSVECLTPHQQLSRCNLQFLLFALHLVWLNLSSSSIDHRSHSSSCAWLLTIRSFVDGAAVSTAGYVKLLLPPRQSRGISHRGLDTLDLKEAKASLAKFGVKSAADVSYWHIASVRRDGAKLCGAWVRRD
jgi:hypothetical protein